MPLRAAERLREFANPVLFTVRQLWAAERLAIVAVTLLGLAAAAINAGALLLLLPLLNAMVGTAGVVAVAGIELAADAKTAARLLVASVTLLIIALALRHAMQILSMDIMTRTAGRAAFLASAQLHRLAAGSIKRRTVQRVQRIAFGSGFMLQQFALSFGGIAQVLVFLCVLLWLSTPITALLIIVGLPVLVLFTRSVKALEVAVTIDPAHDAALGDALERVATLLNEQAITVDSVDERLRQVLADKALTAELARKVAQRRERQRGPLYVEALFPLVLLPIAMATLLVPAWPEYAGLALVYVLILRTTVGLLQDLANQFMAAGRFHPEALDFRSLMLGKMPSIHQQEATGAEAFDD